MGGGGLGVVDGLDKVVVVEVVDVVVEVVDVVEEANVVEIVVDFGFFVLFFFSLFFFFFVVVVKVLLLCCHFFFLLPVLLVDLENKLEQRWQGSSLFSSREKRGGRKNFVLAKITVMVPGRGDRRRRRRSTAALLHNLLIFSLPFLLENKLERWQGSSLFSRSREKEEGEKILFWQKSR